MKQLGHETWSYQTVGEVERDNRSLSVDELFSLSAALSTALTDLLDPTGLNGENNEAIDFGGDITIPATIVRHWTRGAFPVELAGPGSYQPVRVPPELRDEVEAAMTQHMREEAVRRAKKARSTTTKRRTK
jgi:hypothetical protein